MEPATYAVQVTVCSGNRLPSFPRSAEILAISCGLDLGPKTADFRASVSTPFPQGESDFYLGKKVNKAWISGSTRETVLKQVAIYLRVKVSIEIISIRNGGP